MLSACHIFFIVFAKLFDCCFLSLYCCDEAPTRFLTLSGFPKISFDEFSRISDSLSVECCMFWFVGRCKILVVIANAKIVDLLGSFSF